MIKKNELERLFVYGTLAPGQLNSHLLEGLDGKWESASCVGRIYTQTEGVHIGLPCFEPMTQGERFTGKLFSSEQLNQVWQVLDDFEGDQYERRLILVKTAHGNELKAYIYADSSK